MFHLMVRNIMLLCNSLLNDDGRPRPEELAQLVEAHVEDELAVGQDARLNHPAAEHAEPLPHLVRAHHADRLGLLAQSDGALRQRHEDPQRPPDNVRVSLWQFRDGPNLHQMTMNAQGGAAGLNTGKGELSCSQAWFISPSGVEFSGLALHSPWLLSISNSKLMRNVTTPPLYVFGNCRNYLFSSLSGFENASSFSSNVLALFSTLPDSVFAPLAATMPATVACNVLTSGVASSPHGTPSRSN